LSEEKHAGRESAAVRGSDFKIMLAAIRLRYVAGCPRDLRQCPRHFVATSQSTCKPTDEYEGSCALIELPGAADMEHIAMSCNVEWPACMPVGKLQG